MHMTRHQARSSFIFEIKRAKRRTSEVLTPGETSSPSRSSLLEQVFGNSLARPAMSELGRAEFPSEDRSRSGSGFLGTTAREMAAAAEPSAEHAPRRVLPDLLSAHPNPLEERLRKEAEDRSARRRVARENRRMRVEPGAPKKEPAALSEVAPAPNSPSNGHDSISGMPAREPLSLTPDDPSSAAAPRGGSKAKGSANLRAKRRRAQKLDLPLPRLPAGSRWKRRLPWVCW